MRRSSAGNALVALVRLSSNRSSAKAFPKVSITLLYYRKSIICQAVDSHLFQICTKQVGNPSRLTPAFSLFESPRVYRRLSSRPHSEAERCPPHRRYGFGSQKLVGFSSLRTAATRHRPPDARWMRQRSRRTCTRSDRDVQSATRSLPASPASP